MKIHFSRLSHQLRYFTFLFLLMGMTHQASADGGYYVGGSVGTAGLEIDFDGAGFDESDSAMKVYGGYNFDFFVVDVAIEGGYVDFGESSVTLTGTNVSAGATAWTAFGVAGLELGPIGVFGKIGMIKWDIDVAAEGNSNSVSGSDPAIGIGARFSLGSLEARAEYEIFDISGVTRSTDLSMLSVGVVWTF